MRRNHEQLLVATLVGLVIVSAAAFAVAPSQAAGYQVDTTAQVVGVSWWDQLNVRKWPAHYSQKTGSLEPMSSVWVERCIIVESASDWCKVENGNASGWVNSRYLEISTPETFGDL